MADPTSAVTNQLRNIEAKTGKSFAQLCQLIHDSGLAKVGEQRKMLMEHLGLGYGDANMLAIRAKDAASATPADADPLDAIYSGSKAALRPLHDRLSAAIDQLGAHEKAPKKSNVSFRLPRCRSPPRVKLRPGRRLSRRAAPPTSWPACMAEQLSGLAGPAGGRREQARRRRQHRHAAA
jgi:hypothetical protein